jgi:hypothetical protein
MEKAALKLQGVGIEIIARTPLTWQKMTRSSGLPCRSHGSLWAFLEAGAESKKAKVLTRRQRESVTGQD